MSESAGILAAGNGTDHTKQIMVATLLGNVVTVVNLYVVFLCFGLMKLTLNP